MAGQRIAGAESSRRLLSVLLSFTEETPHWSVSDLANTLGLSQSMVYRYIGLLREVGLIDSAGDSRYRVADRIHSLASAAIAGSEPLTHIIDPILENLRDAFDETVLFARRNGWNVFTVQRYESRRPVRLQFDRGQAMSLHRGSMSRLLLAELSHTARDNYLSGLDDTTRALPQLSNDALDSIHTAGVTESFEEIDEGIWGVAALVIRDRNAIGSIGCAAPIYRTDEQRRADIRRHVIHAAREISTRLSPDNPPDPSRWAD